MKRGKWFLLPTRFVAKKVPFPKFETEIDTDRAYW
jgi:hypothetical protein